MPKRSWVLSEKRFELFSVRVVPLKNGIEPVCQVVVPVPPDATGSAVVSASVPKWAADANRFVELAVVAKRLVEVAFASVVLPETVSAPANVLVPVVEVATMELTVGLVLAASAP